MRMSTSSRHFGSFPVFSRVKMALWRKTLPSSCIMCKRETKYACISCGKSVCVRFECSVAESNKDTIGWEENKSVGYCLSCAQVEHNSGNIDVTNYADNDESDSVEGSEKVNSEEGKKKRKKLGRKATWKESQITDMVNVISNDEELVRKLVFTNVKKSSNTDAYEKVLLQLGNDFPFTVKQMRTKFKWCISVCKKACLTMKTASGISSFIDDKGYGKWFDLLYPLVKSRDSCQPERAYEPSAYSSKDEDDRVPYNDDDDDCGSTSSNVTEKTDELLPKSKSLPVKKPTFKKGKTDHVSKALELLQATIDNDPTKELLQFLKEDIKLSREQERMHFQMMCGFMNSNAHGIPHYSQSLHSDSIQSSDAQNVSLSMPHRGSSLPYTPPFSSEAESVSAPISYSGSSRPYTPPLPLRDTSVSVSVPHRVSSRPCTPPFYSEAESNSAPIPYSSSSRAYTPPLPLRDTSVSVSIPHRVSSRPCTPPLSYAAPAVTASIDAAHQSFMGRIQSSLEIPKYQELRPLTPTYMYEESGKTFEG